MNDLEYKLLKLEFNGSKMILITKGASYSISIEQASTKLAQAPLESRSDYSISPSGYGIHWPLLDEDLSVKGLLALATKI